MVVSHVSLPSGGNKYLLSKDEVVYANDDGFSRHPKKEIDIDTGLLEFQDKVSLSFIILLTCFNFAYGLICSSMGLFILPTEAERLRPNAASLTLGFMLGVVGISQLICPISGRCSDYCVNKMGRRRPFIILAAIVCFVSTLGLWICSVFYFTTGYFVCLFVSMLTINVMYSASCGLVPDFVPKEQQGMTSGIVAVQLLLGAVFGFVLVFLTRWYNFHCFYPIYLGLIFAAALTQCLTAKEKPLLSDGDISTIWGIPVLSFADVVRCFTLDMNGSRDFFWVFVGRTFYYIAVSVQAFLLFYIRDMLQVPEEADQRKIMALISLVGQLTGASVAYPIGRLSDDPKIGRKLIIYASCGCMTVVYVIFLILPYMTRDNRVVGIYFTAVLYGIGNGSFLGVDTALALDVIPRKQESAQALGIWGVSAFLGSGIGPMFWGLSLWMCRNPDKVTYSYHGYAIMLLGGGVSVLLSGLVIRMVKKTT